MLPLNLEHIFYSALVGFATALISHSIESRIAMQGSFSYVRYFVFVAFVSFVLWGIADSFGKLPGSMLDTTIGLSVGVVFGVSLATVLKS